MKTPNNHPIQLACAIVIALCVGSLFLCTLNDVQTVLIVAALIMACLMFIVCVTDKRQIG